jgi:LysR family transcriptional regulator, hydrogen peroxide-inducible genes activator
MTIYLPTLKQLQYLVALRDHGHFGRAAESCFVSQSTLSAGLRELESVLGTILVERTRRVVRFTPLGAKIAEKARRVLRETEELADLAKQESQPLTGSLHMGVIPTIAPFLLPVMLPQLRRQWPELKLHLREETSQSACDALHRGQLDCVLLAMPYHCGDVEQAELFDDDLLVAFPAGDAPPGATVPSAAIGNDRLLLLEDGHCLKDHALAVCNRPDLRTGATMLGTSLHTLVQMVDNGLGVTFVPRMAVAAGILNGTSIAVRELESPSRARHIALVWRKASPRSEEFELLAKSLREIHRQTFAREAGAAARAGATRAAGVG